ncbi:hypothetical protein BH18ACI5_BH18ACI5_01970 [soil metagenome]
MNDALLSGAAGAAALTAVHQAARLITDDAPRMDIVGMRALSGGAEAADADLPRDNRLYNMTLAGDLIFNSAYYALATTWTRGAALGLLAGVGALVLPQKMGLGNPPKSELLSNQVMTVAWYLLGGLTAACTAQYLAKKRANSGADLIGGH